MADIKTRDTSKGTIKTINKAAVATERMKKAYVMTKDKAGAFHECFGKFRRGICF